jgi:NTP pyrophosphatase (non-canonical NTP hydrolase)
MASGIADLQKRIRQFVDERDWDQFHNPKDLAISLSLEAAEVLEHFQWKNAEEISEHIKNRRDDVGEEIADVLYWVLLLSNKIDLDLTEAFEKKMQKNEAKYPIEKAKGTHKKYTEFEQE